MQSTDTKSAEAQQAEDRQLSVSREKMGQKPKLKRRKALRITLLALGALIVACAVGFFAYTSDYYHADETALAVLASEGSSPGESDVSDENEGESEITIAERAGSGTISFVPQNPQAGLIFYPGGKVEHTAYAPLMTALAERGIACVLVEMPFNLAVFDIDAAAEARTLVQEEGGLSDIPWYVGGHSLGGSMAAAFLAENASDYAGLVLFASYSTEDLSDLGLNVISVYGSNDQVLNADAYAENLPNLGDNPAELVIEGGNHAQFGSYGPQEGDGEASVSADEQVKRAADFVAESITVALA